MSAHKISRSNLKIYEIVIALLQIDDKNKMFCLFEKTFLIGDISMDIAFRMFFPILSNVNINFNNLKFK